MDYLEGQTEVVPFVKSLTALQGVRLYERIPFNAWIREIMVHWPGGCKGLVDVAVGYEHIRLLPKNEELQAVLYLSLDDITPRYPFREPVTADQHLWCEMLNADSQQPHKITVTVLLERRVD
ncbi:MAG: hypothetical protein Q8O40_13040 [Chloroflexota bacterium]|nr:hypothetical protein [Chloroflexota bacterium]